MRGAAPLAVFVAVAVLGGAARANEGGEPARFLFPAKDVDPALLRSDERVGVTEADAYWTFSPAAGAAADAPALLFFPGGGVDPLAYAPLVRAVAAEGFPVRVVKIALTFGSSDAHRRRAIDLGKTVLAAEPAVRRWVVAGHSMGGAIAAQFVHEDARAFAGLVLIGTTHPRESDLSAYAGDVTKIAATEDRVASLAACEAGRKLLPAATTWIRVEGGNHAQFGSYGAQPGDGTASIAPEEQRRITAEALVAALRRVAAGIRPAAPSSVAVHGSLYGMMHEGKTGAAVRLDALLPNERLYAVGALADLAGEVTVVAGVAHLSFPAGDTATRTETARTSSLGAALLVSAEVAEWTTVVTQTPIPFASLDAAIADLVRGAGLDPDARLPFLVEGDVENLEWHVIDGRKLPGGESSHEAHVAASVRDRRERARATLVGFHSPSDMGTFTHMGSTTHVHCVVPEASSSGHVDRVDLPAGTKVLFPMKAPR